MSEQKVEKKIPSIRDFPVEWQILVRATQSLSAKARDGADVRIVKEDNYFAFVTKKTSLEVAYHEDRKMLEIVWKKYNFIDEERVPTFIKTIEKRMEESEARKLMFVWFEKILYHIDYKSNTSVIYDDFYYLYKVIEEELKEQKEEAKK
jgi:hypothetical protein